MKLLYIVDGRSHIALNWISYFIRAGHEIHLVSTYPCQPVDGAASQEIVPVAMSEYYGYPGGENPSRSMVRKLIPVSLRTKIRQWLAPWSFPQAASSLRRIINRVEPDLVHAMRIPFEGMIASMAMGAIIRQGESHSRIPFLISVWGNDFTLHARSTPTMKTFTQQALRACDGLHTDCQRDMVLAKELGFVANKPGIVLPGGGGIRLEIFFPAQDLEQHRENQILCTVINPRGFRAYVRNDTFFHAIPLVLEKYDQVRFLCPGMAGETQAQQWAAELGITDHVELLGDQSQPGMAELFRQSQISVSITTHDGTPNTLLEALACGCFPIAGDIESIREWIAVGENGLLVDPGDPRALANAIIEVISKPELRVLAREHNLAMVRERAEYGKCMQRAGEFYQELAGKHTT